MKNPNSNISNRIILAIYYTGLAILDIRRAGIRKLVILIPAFVMGATNAFGQVQAVIDSAFVNFTLNPPAYDIGVDALTYPEKGCLSDCESVKLAIKNYADDTVKLGCFPIAEVFVEMTGPTGDFSADAGVIGAIPPGDTMEVSIEACFDMSKMGAYKFTAYTNMIEGEDVDSSNNAMDTAKVEVGGDIGAIDITYPKEKNCYESCEHPVVQIKNYCEHPIILHSDSTAKVFVMMDGPTGQFQSSQQLTGVIEPGQTKNVSLKDCFDLSKEGTYTFEAHTDLKLDLDQSNNAMDSKEVESLGERPKPGIEAELLDNSAQCRKHPVLLTATGPYDNFTWQTKVVLPPGTWTVTAWNHPECKGSKSITLADTEILCSSDPNDITGPEGFGPERWVSVNDVLNYKIRYENSPEFATAPAQEVAITQALDPHMDPTSFRLSDFGFGGFTFTVPNNTAYYSQRIDLVDTLGFFLDVFMGIDVTKNELFWKFNTIDPVTGLKPTNPFLGYLPINDTTSHNGEGFVNYSIKPRPSTQTGDSIKAKASIIFDINDPIVTPQTFNVVDALPPGSMLDSLPPDLDSTNITITWQGADDAGGSGLRSYDLWVSENGQPFTLAEGAIADTQTVYYGAQGNTYAFYTIARDNVNNLENHKEQGDYTVTLGKRIDILQPVGEETLCSRQSYSIDWESRGINAVRIELSVDGSNSFDYLIADSVTASPYAWFLADSVPGGTVNVIRITDVGDERFSTASGNFTIIQSPAIDHPEPLAIDQCVGDTLIMEPVVTGSDLQYQWLQDGEAIPGATDPVYTITYARHEHSGGYALQVFNTCDTIQSDIAHLLVDTMAPVIVCADDVVHLTDPDACTADISLMLPKVSDTCGVDTLYNNAPPAFPLGETFVDWTVVDHSGNRSSCTQKVTVVDEEDPIIINCPTDIQVVADSNDCDPVVTWTPPLADDNCSLVNLVSSHEPGDEFPLGLTTVTYTATDLAGNESFCRFDIEVNPKPLVVQLNAPEYYCGYQISCAEATDGKATASVSGGCLPYSFSWSDGQTTRSAMHLPAGWHWVEVTDQKGTSITDSIRLSEPDQLTITDLSSPTFVCGYNISCNGANDGSINLDLTGGANCNEYTYAWTTTDGAGLDPTAEDQSGLIAGTYHVTITDDNGCSISNSITLTEPDQLVITDLSSPTFVCGYNISCNGANDGSINLDLTGGASCNVYTYAWTTTDGAGLDPTTEDQSGLIAGTYHVTITDDNGCSISNSITLTEPGPLVITDLSSPTYVCGYNISCNGANDGSINLDLTGGASCNEYTYAWTTTDGAGLDPTAEDQSGLIAGTYHVTITDDNGCSISNSITLTEPDPLVITDLSSPTFVCGYNISCNGANDGSINLDLTGGASCNEYTYAWTTTDGAGLDPTAEDQSGLIAGTYHVTITDDNGCSISNSITLTEPDQLVITDLSSPTYVCGYNISCNGANDGSINLDLIGGAVCQPYRFAWTGPNGLTATSQNLTDLYAGTYLVTITDSNGCSIDSSITLSQPDPLVITDLSSPTYDCGFHISCHGLNDGSINLDLTGGAVCQPYRFTWTGPNGFTASSQVLTDLYAGTYHITITDSNGCSIDSSITLSQPDAFVITDLSSPTYNCGVEISCHGYTDGSINLDMEGGANCLPYTYSWNGPNGFTSTSEDPDSLEAGTYSVFVMDENGCTADSSITLQEPDPLVVDTGQDPDTLLFGCACTDLSVLATGSCPPYQYSWSSGETTPDILACPPHTGTSDTSQIDIPYIATITDDNACSASDTVRVRRVPRVHQIDAYALFALGRENPPAGSNSSSNDPDLGKIKLGNGNIVTGALGTQKQGSEVRLGSNNTIHGFIAAGTLDEGNNSGSGSASASASADESGSSSGSSNDPPGNSLGALYTGIGYPGEPLVTMPELCSCYFGNGNSGSSGSQSGSASTSASADESGSSSGSSDDPLACDLKVKQTTATASPGCYCTIEVDKATLYLEPGIYTLERLKVKKDGKLLSTTGNAEDVLIYVTDYTVDINNYTTIEANILASGKIKVGKENVIRGALIGEEITIGNDNQITWAGFDCYTGVVCPTVKHSHQPAEEEENPAIRGSFIRAYPNPFEGSTTIEFMLDHSGHGVLTVYNAAGAAVAILFDREFEAHTRYKVVLDGTHLAKGVYFYQLITPNEIFYDKITHIK